MKRFFGRVSRRVIRGQLARSSAKGLMQLGQKKLIRCFQRAAKQSPAYRILLTEAGVDPLRVRSFADFIQACPILEKANTFQRFKISELIAGDIRPDSIASILTSSGHGANGYALGLSTREQLVSTPTLIDLGLDMAFDVDRYHTLLINCLPMGVTFQSNAVCVANVSVREDMACAIVEQSGDLFDQIILCGDPLFLKRLCDYSRARNLDWGRYRMNAVIGEETFTESFRDYLAATLKIDLDDRSKGLIGSSMGVGELGLNLFNETRETIAIRRACNRSPQLLAALCGTAERQSSEETPALQKSPDPLPTFLAFNPLRTFVEILAPDANGVGDLVVTLLDIKNPVPLMRYRTGDRARFLEPTSVAKWIETECSAADRAQFGNLALPMIALQGRAKDRLPGGWHVDMFKDALYQLPEVADQVSGAFRISRRDDLVVWEVQLARDATPVAESIAVCLRHVLQACRGAEATALHVSCIAYTEFPYGQSLDYERKFTYWAG